MTQSPRTIFEHLRHPDFAEGDGRGVSRRLSLGELTFPAGWLTVKRMVESEDKRHLTWFPDSNIAIHSKQRADVDDVWTAMRVAALGTNQPSVRISSGVFSELKEWLDAPYGNESLASALRSSLTSKTGWARAFSLDRVNRNMWEVAISYIRLVSSRRTMAYALPSGMTVLGTPADRKGDVMNAIKDRMGLRAMRIAKKGRDELESKGFCDINDEILCIEAIVFALAHGRETAILTTDYDVVEAFFKMQWFLTLHYFAWIAGERIKRGEFGAPVLSLPDTKGYFFDGDCRLYDCPMDRLRRALPRKFNPVDVHLVYVPANSEVKVLTSHFECQMLGMLKTRFLTHGCSTAALGGDNVHVNVALLPGQPDGEFIGVAKDLMLPFSETRVDISQLDMTLAINNREHHARHRIT